MPMIDVGDCRLNVSVEGNADGPTLMLSNSLGTAMAMWEPQMAAFGERFRVIRYDCRGHGQSEIGDTPYSVERLGRDVVAILDALDVEKTHWCGLSIGGMIGQWLGANASHRFDRLVLSNTSSYYPDPTNWDNRIRALSDGGYAAIADGVLNAWLTPGFREREPGIVADMKAMLVATPPAGYIETCKALRTLDQRALLPGIPNPTLVIAGREDPATPPAAGEFIASEIPGARLVMLDAAHISNVEQPGAFIQAVLDFLG